MAQGKVTPLVMVGDSWLQDWALWWMTCYMWYKCICSLLLGFSLPKLRSSAVGIRSLAGISVPKVAQPILNTPNVIISHIYILLPCSTTCQALGTLALQYANRHTITYLIIKYKVRKVFYLTLTTNIGRRLRKSYYSTSLVATRLLLYCRYRNNS